MIAHRGCCTACLTLLWTLYASTGSVVAAEFAGRPGPVVEPDVETMVAVGELHEPALGESSYRLIDRSGEVQYHFAADAAIELEPFVGHRVLVRGEAHDSVFSPTEIELLDAASAARPASHEANEALLGSDQKAYELVAPPDPDPTEELIQRAPYAPLPCECESCNCRELDCCRAVGCCSTIGCRPHRMWLRAEYLVWWSDDMHVPPLVTSSPAGTPRLQTGVLGQPDTTILVGNEGIDFGSHDGFRIRFGFWLDPCQQVGLEGDYYRIGEENRRLFFESAGDPQLARPFFDVLQARERSELVALENVLEGSVSVDATSEFQAAGARYRWNLCCLEGCRRSCCGPVPTRSRLDFMAGYRFARLREGLVIRELLFSQDVDVPEDFDLRDSFRTTNEFHGGEIGFLWETCRRRWNLELLTRLAVGNARQEVTIGGSTLITPEGEDPSLFTGGLLAQRSNIGTRSRDQLAILPEISATLGYQLTPCLRLTTGYTFVYFSNVVRPGEQIDRDVNTTLIPPEESFTGPLRPQFAFNCTDYWAHGVNLGLDYRW